MKLIDKDKVVIGVERMLHETVNNTDGSLYYGGRVSAFTAILSFLDTLEVKEVNLESEVEKCLKKYQMLAVGKKDFTCIAKHFFELGH